jgi:hypothetical protein
VRLDVFQKIKPKAKSLQVEMKKFKSRES